MRLPKKDDVVNVFTKHQELKICDFKRDDCGFTFWIHNTKWPCPDVKYWAEIAAVPSITNNFGQKI
jgi:hypothetical protein